MRTKFSKDVVSLADLKVNQGKIVNQAFVKAIAQGLIDIENDKTVSLSGAKKRLGIKCENENEFALADLEDIKAYKASAGYPEVDSNPTCHPCRVHPS